MTTTTTVRSRGAILLGGIFALGPAYVFGHVRSLADITTDHVMSLVLGGTIAAGHMFWPGHGCHSFRTRN
jgi:hypothetical protein